MVAWFLCLIGKGCKVKVQQSILQDVLILGRNSSYFRCNAIKRSLSEGLYDFSINDR